MSGDNDDLLATYAQAALNSTNAGLGGTMTPEAMVRHFQQYRDQFVVVTVKSRDANGLPVNTVLYPSM